MFSCKRNTLKHVFGSLSTLSNMATNDQLDHGLILMCIYRGVHITQIYSGITSGRVLDGYATPRRLKRNLHETICRQMQTNSLLESLCIEGVCLYFKCSFENLLMYVS